MKLNTETIAKWIREKRINSGLTQKQFAEMIFEDPKRQPFVHRIETGRGITIETLGKILEKLDCEIEINEPNKE